MFTFSIVLWWFVVSGEGGFGHVVLCVNKLDGRRYAMKKIRLKAKTLSQNNKILRFVNLLNILFKVLEDLVSSQIHFRVKLSLRRISSW